MKRGRDYEKWLAERLRTDPEEALAYMRASWEPDADYPDMTDEQRHEAFAMSVERVYNALWATPRLMCQECKRGIT